VLDNPEEKQFSIVSVVLPYGIALSLLYLFGYWSTFGINILHYASLSDVIKLAIYPVFIGALLLLFSTFIQMLVMGQFKETDSSKVYLLMSPRLTMWTSIGAIIMALGIIWLRHGDGFAWILVGILLAYIVKVNIADSTIMNKFNINPVLRNFIIYALLVLFFSSFGIGKRDAENIINAKNAKVVRTVIFKGVGTEDFKKKALLEKHATLKYLGSSGDYFFFLTPDNEATIIAKYQDLYFLEFRNK
jgi:hypothetical protein